MSLFQKLAGVMGFFQVGGPAGSGLNNNAGVLESKNAANSAFVVHRAATPVGDNDLTTKQYVDTIFKPIPVSLQFNGNNALPANTGTEQYYITTTTGPNAAIGTVIWDDGTGVGTAVVLPAKTGNEIVTTTSFSGGTITLQTNQNYVWSGAAWTNISPNVSGVVLAIRMAITTAASQSSATSIPANAIVHSVLVNVTVGYSAGTTIAIGQAGTTTLLQATTDNTPTVANTPGYLSELDQAWGASALPVLVTVAGAPAAGAGFVTVLYSLPNA
jgi:hypothetical protein